MKKMWRLVVSANLCLIATLVLSACSPAAQTNLPVTQTNLPAYPNFASTPTPKITFTAYPTVWQDFTPTPNLTPGVWPEFSSQFTFMSPPEDYIVGPLHYRVRYPPDWYLYPGNTVIYAGEARGTDIQNYKGVTNQESLRLEAGRAHLMLIAKPCKTTEQGCPAGLPLLSPGFPGTQEVRLDEFNHLTYWNTFLYINDMQFAMYGVMFGTPEENTDLIKTLDEILSTIVIDESVPLNLIEPTPIQLPFVKDFKRDCNNPAVVHLPIADTQGWSEDDIAEKLMSLLLDSFNNPQVSDFCRIDGYRIEKVYYDSLLELPTFSPKGDFMRAVEFSVKLIQIPNVWMVYSGEIDQQNWLHTSETLAISKDEIDGVYMMRFSRP